MIYSKIISDLDIETETPEIKINIRSHLLYHFEHMEGGGEIFSRCLAG